MKLSEKDIYNGKLQSNMAAIKKLHLRARNNVPIYLGF